MAEPRFSPARRLAAEALGSAMLLMVVVGSGIMADRLAGDPALALLANTAATGAGLAVLILLFQPVSGAHFNPVVTLIALLSRKIEARLGAAYVAAQVCGAVVGVWLAHAMFGLPILQWSLKARDQPGEVLSEAVATFGLIAIIIGVGQRKPAMAPAAVGLYVASAYWFTASTAFANPAVTLARGLSDTFAGIAPASIPGFIAAQFIGAFLAADVMAWLLKEAPA